MINKEILLNFKPHLMLKTNEKQAIKELKEWQNSPSEKEFRMNYLLGELKTTEYILHYPLAEEQLIESGDLMFKACNIFKDKFESDNFIILSYFGSNIRVYGHWLNDDVKIFLPRPQEISLTTLFSLDNKTEYYQCGTILVFKNEDDMLLTKLTNCFGVFK